MGIRREAPVGLEWQGRASTWSCVDLTVCQPGATARRVRTDSAARCTDTCPNPVGVAALSLNRLPNCALPFRRNRRFRKLSPGLQRKTLGPML